ncbi:MAG: minor capsid protein [Prevotella sp.]|nr:minor capsid protein [Prevotella sp.]
MLTLVKGIDVPEADRQRLRQKFEGMMRALHKEQGATLRIEIMADKPVLDFIDTHADVLDAAVESVKMSDDMRQRLERSNWIFSGMKTFHELNEAFPSLTNEDGSRKSFERFLNDVQKIDDTYNRNYLRSEYNFVQSSADMAAKWEEFAADGDRYLLQYRTAGDDKVRPEHAELNGVTLPIDDGFWAEYYPPNGWNCRCTVVQVRRGKYEVTPHDEAMTRGEIALQRDTRGIFRFNSGIQQKTVPDYNPYTISQCRSCDIAKGNIKLAFIPSNQLCQGCQLIRQCYADRQKSEAAVTKKHYLSQMEPLKHRKVAVNGNGHSMSVGFSQMGNKHLYADAYKGKIDKEELPLLDKMLQKASFVTKASLSKPRPNDDIKRFYYYRTVNRNGQEIFLNVAETDHRMKNGQWFHKRFLYSITRTIKE